MKLVVAWIAPPVALRKLRFEPVRRPRPDPVAHLLIHVPMMDLEIVGAATVRADLPLLVTSAAAGDPVPLELPLFLLILVWQWRRPDLNRRPSELRSCLVLQLLLVIPEAHPEVISVWPSTRLSERHPKRRDVTYWNWLGESQGRVVRQESREALVNGVQVSLSQYIVLRIYRYCYRPVRWATPLRARVLPPTSKAFRPHRETLPAQQEIQQTHSQREPDHGSDQDERDRQHHTGEQPHRLAAPLAPHRVTCCARSLSSAATQSGCIPDLVGVGRSRTDV